MSEDALTQLGQAAAIAAEPSAAVLETAEAEGRGDIGLLRLRTVATKNRSCGDFPDYAEDGSRDPDVVLDLDYWAVMPRR